MNDRESGSKSKSLYLRAVSLAFGLLEKDDSPFAACLTEHGVADLFGVAALHLELI